MIDDKHDLPIRELLRDISGNNEPPRTPRGLVGTQVVNRMTYLTAMIWLVLSAATFLAMIWEVIDPIFGFRCLGTFGIVLLAVFFFRAINSLID